MESICPICLRTDRKVNAIPIKLLDYHDELTDYMLPLEDLYYCSDCECLLRKTYNFKQKCINAAKILKVWMKTTVKELTPAILLHQKMPPICLDGWRNGKVFNCIYEDNKEDSIVVQESVSEIPDNDILKKLNMSNELDRNGIKYENIESMVIVKKTSETESKYVQHQMPGVLHTPFPNYNNGSEDIINVIQNNLAQNNNTITKLPNNTITKLPNNTITKSPQKKRMKKTNLESNININQTKLQNTSRKPDYELDDVKNHTKLNNKSVMNDTDLDTKSFDNEILDDMVTRNDENESVTECSNGLAPKERVMKVLRDRGELATEDGHVFDKDFILNMLDKFSDRVLERLARLLHGSVRLPSDAVRLLRTMSEKRRDAPYGAVFEVRYLLTERDRRDEFRARTSYRCYRDAPFKCLICYQGFNNQKYLDNHKKAHDDVQKPYQCPICRVRVYRRKHHTHGAVYRCRRCPLVTYHRNSMVNHYEQHQGTVYPCGKCDKIFKSKSVQLNHRRTVHPSAESACARCGLAFVSRRGLHAHTRVKHRGASQVPAGDASYSCTECTLSFLSEAACARHHKQTHIVRQMTRRKNVGLSKKPVYSCPECGAAGGGYGWVVKHYRAEHPAVDVKQIYAHRQRYLCHICGKIFNNKTCFTQHINIHSGIKLSCPVCDRQFDKIEYLKLHAGRHYPPRYACTTCGKKFHTPANLFSHTRVHVGDRRYKCHICGKGFLRSTSLKGHIRGVHCHEPRVNKQGAARRRRVVDLTDNTDELAHTDTFNELAHTDTFMALEIGAEEIVS